VGVVRTGTAKFRQKWNRGRRGRLTNDYHLCNRPLLLITFSKFELLGLPLFKDLAKFVHFIRRKPAFFSPAFNHTPRGSHLVGPPQGGPRPSGRFSVALGKPLPLIPFVFHGASHAMPDVGKLPLADVIAMNA
jgi:hypothetical protein